jgi:hypothetical protein
MKKPALIYLTGNRLTGGESQGIWLRARFVLAWGVFTGKYDAVTWSDPHA